jgi:hypothetical protein
VRVVCALVVKPGHRMQQHILTQPGGGGGSAQGGEDREKQRMGDVAQGGR